ncbi:hypothetical protein CDCA_CDCA02G0480 [Cyanidium caldarium]|uniref:Magnesium-protoporphyrin IX methyltransferase C-terminal domain-containing protein n=1 Tax=Cyanidium caldarium TaxID=2771 RepID=A0AAV9IQ85_CYACA|nr:hypothetical protein CDCA_CDCA02G0480 [Cyanidium caldarium]
MAPGKKPVLNRHYAFISPAAVPRGVSGADRAVCPGSARSWRRCGVARLQGAVDEKDVVAQYFNSNGFERWRKIYSETAEVNRVQRDIRDGHRQTVEAVLHMLDEDGTDYAQHTFCDAGCGVGSLALPLAQRNAKRVTAFDISEAMVNEARRRADELLPPEQRARCDFRVADVEGFRSDHPYDTICCVDVMIHYPTERAEAMLRHLSSMARSRMIITFAPKTLYYVLLKKVGELFPGPSRVTRAYQHSEADIRAALRRLGWQVRREHFTATWFYFSKLLEVVRAPDTPNA